MRPGAFRVVVYVVPVLSERDLRLEDGRVLRVYDSAGPDAADAFAMDWLVAAASAPTSGVEG